MIISHDNSRVTFLCTWTNFGSEVKGARSRSLVYDDTNIRTYIWTCLHPHVPSASNRHQYATQRPRTSLKWNNLKHETALSHFKKMQGKIVFNYRENPLSIRQSTHAPDWISEVGWTGSSIPIISNDRQSTWISCLLSRRKGDRNLDLSSSWPWSTLWDD